ncbi:hypothetical protein AB0K18_08665 [Nonomuraea sp. NPDC049421]|uniref:hypothetical protein n=1 Tax=Nonomuraea sp. NPDC049421 TaxID=3155275 RepID=UPI00342505FF
MSRVCVVAAVLVFGAVLPVGVASAASAEVLRAGTVTIADCVIGAGIIMPSSSSPTRLVCVGGLHNGKPVGGIA